MGLATGGSTSLEIITTSIIRESSKELVKSTCYDFHFYRFCHLTRKIMTFLLYRCHFASFFFPLWQLSINTFNDVTLDMHVQVSHDNGSRIA